MYTMCYRYTYTFTFKDYIIYNKIQNVCIYVRLGIHKTDDSGIIQKFYPKKNEYKNT